MIFFINGKKNKNINLKENTHKEIKNNIFKNLFLNHQLKKKSKLKSEDISNNFNNTKNTKNTKNLNNNFFENNTTPLRGGYLVKNPVLYFYLKFIDFITSYFKIFSKKNNEIKDPKKIIISNIAHLGDALVATSILPVIKQKFPNSQIGFVCSSTSKELLKDIKLIDDIYIVDHSKLNRFNFSFLKKIIIYLQTKSKALHEIKAKKYDVAIDLYSYFPNSIYFFWKAKIPVRIGYTSAGFKNFLTHELDWKCQEKHISEYHFDLLKYLGFTKDDRKFLKMQIPFFSTSTDKVTLPKDFILIHVGAGDSKKMWSLDKWIDLTNKMTECCKNLVFTGKGFLENQQISQLIDGKKNCTNLCDKLSLSEMFEVISKAKVVICIDSLVLHISSALNIKTIVLYCGINNFNHWVINSKNILVLQKKVGCSPCYNKSGCDNMDCLNKIESDEVIKAMESFYEKSI